MKKMVLAIALAYSGLAHPALADVFRFDFSGLVLAETKPLLTVTPRPISGFLTYTAPSSGDVTTLVGDGTLFTDLYGTFDFTQYSTTLDDDRFTFSGTLGTDQGFSLRLSELANSGTYGFGASGDGFALTGSPVNATGQISGNFTGGVAAVPEPAAWMMMIAGFGMAGTALRASVWRKRSVRAASYGATT